MTEARTTTIIRKVPGRRASDDGRSRLADYTRPVARAQRITKNRKPAVLFGLVALVVAVAIGAALFGLPVRTWFGQDQQLHRLQDQLEATEDVNAELQNEVDRLQTDAGLLAAAREELGLIEFGEQRRTVGGWPLLPDDLPDGWPYSAAEQLLALRRAEAAAGSDAATGG